MPTIADALRVGAGCVSPTYGSSLVAAHHRAFMSCGEAATPRPQAHEPRTAPRRKGGQRARKARPDRAAARTPEGRAGAARRPGRTRQPGRHHAPNGRAPQNLEQRAGRDGSTLQPPGKVSEYGFCGFRLGGYYDTPPRERHVTTSRFWA